MSLVPLSRLVRRARSLAQADTDLLQAALEAIPREELRRLAAFAKDILEEDRHSDSSEASVLSTCQAPDLGAREPVDTDLLGLGSDAVPPESSAAAGPSGVADEGGLPSDSVPGSGDLSATVPADLDDHESDDGEIEPLPEWEWSESSPAAESAAPVADPDPAVAGASPSLLAEAPPWLQELDLNAMDDDAVPPGRPPARAPPVAAPPDLSAPAPDDAGTGSEHNAPVATDSTEGSSLAVAALCEAPPGGAGGQDGGTGGAASSASEVPTAAQPALPVAQAATEPPPTCRLELSGSAELPYLCAVDVLQGLEVPSHVLPLRFPLQRLPKVLREHGHSLSGYCAAPCRARCGFCCGRPVSNTSRRSHSGHYCSQCRRD